MYSQTFWDHVRHPRNDRTLPDAKTGEARYQRCGDRLTLYIQTENGRITQATFKARACAPVVAVASLATEMIQGLELDAARKLDIFQLDRKLGGIPPSKRHAYLLFLECLNKSLNEKLADERNN